MILKERFKVKRTFTAANMVVSFALGMWFCAMLIVFVINR